MNKKKQENQKIGWSVCMVCLLYINMVPCYCWKSPSQNAKADSTSSIFLPWAHVSYRASRLLWNRQAESQGHGFINVWDSWAWGQGEGQHPASMPTTHLAKSASKPHSLAVSSLVFTATLKVRTLFCSRECSGCKIGVKFTVRHCPSAEHTMTMVSTLLNQLLNANLKWNDLMWKE